MEFGTKKMKPKNSRSSTLQHVECRPYVITVFLKIYKKILIKKINKFQDFLDHKIGIYGIFPILKIWIGLCGFRDIKSH